jgi:hypothetical protein
VKTRSMQTFDEACNDVAASLVPFGFTYRKTKRRSFRQGKLFDHLVGFATSRSTNSIPGEVHLSITALARSDDLAAYRRTIGWRTEYSEPYLFDVPIENIWRPAPPYIRYDIGESVNREDVLKQVKRILAEEVVPFFDLLEQPSALQQTLAKQNIPGLTEEAAQHYFGYLLTQ